MNRRSFLSMLGLAPMLNAAVGDNPLLVVTTDARTGERICTWHPRDAKLAGGVRFG